MVPEKTLLREFYQAFSKINVLLWKKNKKQKKLYCIQPLWCTAKLDKFHAVYLVLTKEIAQRGHLGLGGTKTNFKNLKP